MFSCKPPSSPESVPPPGHALWDCVSEPASVAVPLYCDNPADEDPDAKMRENRWFKQIEKTLKERNIAAGQLLFVSSRG